jgi:hypothetical protein
VIDKREFSSEMASCVREPVRGAREFIWWTVKKMVNGRLVMDYAPRCHCGVQADR